MTTLPDLDPNTAGHVAFYNAVEQGGLTEDMMTWSDVIDNGSVNSYNVYDNGLIVKYDDDAWGNLTIRLKTDGWVVAYTGWDGSSPGSVDGASPHQISAISGGSSYSSLTSNRLAKAIEDMLSDLTDWPEQTVGPFSKSDIGLYDFAYGSDGISLFAKTGGNDGSFSHSISEASGTNLHVGTVFLRANAESNGTSNLKIDGTEVYKSTGGAKYTQDVSNNITNTGSIDVGLGGNFGGSVNVSAVVGGIFYWSEA